VSRAVHKAMAKQPWNRYDSAREFGETLQKALRNEPIPMFDPARTQPRIRTASKALEKGDYQFASEIVTELESEGNLDPQITMLRAQIDQQARKKTLAQLLESARARYEEEEDPLALQKIHEVLQLDPTNVAALGLRAKIEDRRSERQFENWISLARQHVDNHSYPHAHEALRNAVSLRPKDSRVTRLTKEIESAEQEYLRLRREKSDLYEEAVNAWKNGDVSHALSQMKHVLELDVRAPDGVSSSDTAGVYQSFYDRIRSDYDAINNGYAEARRHLEDRDFGNALETCHAFLEKYPGHSLFQALKFDIEEQQRQHLSAFIADVNRRLDAEADLDAKLNLVREAAAAYPEEAHFARLSKTLEDKRDLVNSLVERARLHEARGQFSEAVADLETLQTIYGSYPGLSFEKDRLRRRFEQNAREVARARWAAQVRQQLDGGDYERALELLDKAQSEHPDDQELTEFRRLATDGLERVTRADSLLTDGQRLFSEGQFDEGVAALHSALQLDDRTVIRITLRDLLVARSQALLEENWSDAKHFAESALEVDPNHALAKSLRARALDKKQDEFVERCSTRVRSLIAAGDIAAASREIEQSLAEYPGDDRLLKLLGEIKSDFTETTAAAGKTPPTRAPAPSHARRTASAPSGATEESQPPSGDTIAWSDAATVIQPGKVGTVGQPLKLGTAGQPGRGDTILRPNAGDAVLRPDEGDTILRIDGADSIRRPESPDIDVEPEVTLLKPPSGARVRVEPSVPAPVETQKIERPKVQRTAPVPVSVPEAKPRQPFALGLLLLTIAATVAVAAVGVYVWRSTSPGGTEPVTQGIETPAPAAAPVVQPTVPESSVVSAPPAPPAATETAPPPPTQVQSPPPPSPLPSPKPPPGAPLAAPVATPVPGGTPPPPSVTPPPVRPVPVQTETPRGSGPSVPAAQPSPPPVPAATRAAELMDAAAQSEKKGDWPAALKGYESARALDPSVASLAAAGITRVQTQMTAEGTDAFKRARQYDALDRVDDAIVWYERAVRNLPDNHPDKRTATERLRVLNSNR
jgi:Flp pilus assembly protein TadD